MFATTELARRIESAEASLTRDVVASTSRRGVVAHELGDGAIGVWSGGSPFDKVIGWGFGDADEQLAKLRAFEDAVRAQAAIVQVELSTLADAGRAESLSRAGYVLVGFENVLGISLADASTLAPNGIEVRRAREGEDDGWIDAVVDGFATPDTEGVASHEHFEREVLVRSLRDMCAMPTHRRYLAWVGGEIAGAAGLRVGSGVAQLAGASTLPAFRRRGVQTALLRARLEDARTEGCDLAVVTTQPGSPSQRNAQRRGFSLLYARAILVRALA